MAHMVGADPAELDALAARMTTAAERLESIRCRIGTLLAHSHWEGRDADDFHQLWHHQLAPRLHSAADLTRAGAVSLRVNAQQQRDASGTASNGTGGQGVLGPTTIALVNDLFDRIDKVIGIGEIMILPLDVVDVLKKHLGPVLARLPEVVKALFFDPAHHGIHRLWPHLDDAVHVLSKIKVGPLAALATAASGAAFLHGVIWDRGNTETWDDGADFAFTVAAMGVGAFCPPLGLAIGVAGMAYDFYNDANPGVTESIVRGAGSAVSEAAQAVVEGARHHPLVEAGGQVIDSAAEVARDVVEGGWNSISQRLGW